MEVTQKDIICTPLAKVLGAHTSTVTGVLFLGGSRYLSVGIDQKIRIWKDEGERLWLFCEGYTFVPDVCGIADLGLKEDRRRFVVFGTGMELLEWQDDVA